MSGLYNAVFGYNVGMILLAPMLVAEDPREYFPRFRDCYEEDGKIVVYTRVGGGNRSYDTKPPYTCQYDDGDSDAEWDFHEDKLYKMPTFVETYDDDFDNTYGYYVFDVPEEWRKDFEKIMEGKLGSVSDAYIERIAGIYGLDPKEFRKDFEKVDTSNVSAAPDWQGFFDKLEASHG